jgi:hypothetical protein
MFRRPFMRICRPNMREEARFCRPDMREQVDLICVENCQDAHRPVNRRACAPPAARGKGRSRLPNPPFANVVHLRKFGMIVSAVDFSEALALTSEAVS